MASASSIKHQKRARVEAGASQVRPWPVIAQVGLLVVVVCVLFLPTLKYEFINYDVYDQVIDNPLIRSLSPDNLYRVFTSLSTTSYYPIRVLSFAIDYAIWELNPKGYHLSNVLIHLANVLLVYALLRRTLVWAAEAGEVGLRGAAAMVGATLFAVHPIVAEPVCWQGAREELLMTFFMFASVHCYLSARKMRADGLPAERRRPQLGILLYALSAVFCAFSCMSSAIGAATPLVVTAGEWALLGTRRPGRVLARTGVLWLIGLAAVIGKWLSHAEELTYAGPKITPADRPLVVLSTYALNLRTIVWPHKLTLLYPHEVPAGFLQPDVVAGLVLVAATLAVLWLVRRNRPALFALLWFILALAPSAQVIPHQHFRADRFLYAPLVGVALAVGTAVAWASRRRWARAGALGVSAGVLIALALRTWMQLPVWENNISLFTHCIAIHPTALAYNNRGTTYGKKGMNEEAIADFTASLKLQPDVPEMHFNRARAHLQARHYDEARADLRRVIELDPQGRAGHMARQVLAYMDGKRLGLPAASPP